MTIRSYRGVFRLERRLFRLGRWRIPLPFGVPLAVLGYLAGLEALVLAAGRLPLAGLILAALPAPLVYAIAPGAAAIALWRARPDGRALPRAAMAATAFVAGPRRLALLRRADPRQARIADLRVAHALDGARLRPARITSRAGATLRLAYPCRGARGRLAQGGSAPLGAPQTIALAPRGRLRVS